MPGAYYSGDLVGINQGRTADARVAADSEANFQNYLASLVANRTRQNIANTEANTALKVASGDQSIRRELGLGDIALRSNLGQGALANTAAATAQSGTLGNRALDLEATKVANDLATKNRELDLMKANFEAGGGIDYHLREAIMKQQESISELEARARTAATIANSQLESTANQGHFFQHYTPGTKSNLSLMRSGDSDYADVPGKILQQVGPDAGLIEWDPTTTSFRPSTALFRRTIGPTPAPAAVPRTFVPTTLAAPGASVGTPALAPAGIPNFQFVPGNQNQPTVFQPSPVVAPSTGLPPGFLLRQFQQNYPSQ